MPGRSNLWATVGPGGQLAARMGRAPQTRAADLDRNLKTARKAVLANDEPHWRRAAIRTGFA